MPTLDCRALDAVRSFDDLRAFIRQELCARENLLEDQFPLSEAVLKQNGVPCGVRFVLHGPRQVKLSAVWTADRNLIYFYDAAGERFRKEELPQRFAMEK